MQSKQIQKNNKYLTILRWIILMPSVFIGGLITFIASLITFSLIFTIINSIFDIINIETPETYLSFGFGLIISSIISFFIGKIIAPKYKNTIGYISAFLSILFEILFTFILSYMILEMSKGFI